MSSSLKKLDSSQKSLELVGWVLRLQRYGADCNKVLGKLIRKHKKALHVAAVAGALQILQVADADKLAQDIATILAHKSSLALSGDEVRSSHLSLMECGLRLLELGTGADFEIVILSPTPTVFKCHSFILHARWPYFNALVGSNMKESHNMRLELPDETKDGGVSPILIQSILEIAYIGVLTKETRERLTLPVILRAAKALPIYLSAPDGLDSTFLDLAAQIDIAHKFGLSLDNCIEVYKAAKEVNNEEFIGRSKDLVTTYIKDILADPKRRMQLFSLPQDVQNELLWTCLAKVL
jgi:hypothetical protein